MAELIDRTGQVHGRLTVLSRAENTRHCATAWLCACECGERTVVTTDNLRAGRTKSCGCGRRTHGATRSPDWNRWMSMIRRCHLPSDRAFKNYGGRGITVCERWRGPDGFINYMADMGDRPTPQHTVERVDNDLGYSPENCEWATRAVQLRNRRNNIRVESEGRSLVLTDWATLLGINPATLLSRWHRGERGSHLLRPTESQGRRRHPATSLQ